MAGFFQNIGTWISSTNLPQQIKDVDYVGLFTNPWFLVPFIALIIYLLYKQSWNSVIIICVCLGLWVFSGSHFMKDIFVGGEMQVEKVLPVIGVGVIALGIIVYVLFIRSD